jgi:hypothetical protein
MEDHSQEKNVFFSSKLLAWEIMPVLQFGRGSVIVLLEDFEEDHPASIALLHIYA